MGDDHDGKTQASCWQHGSLGWYDKPEDAANAELQHQIAKHPVQLQGGSGNSSSKTSGRKAAKPAKLTRDQKRNNFKKPGKK